MPVEIQGRQVRGIREALGLSVAQMAAVLGVHPSTVHRWEGAGTRTAKVDGVAASVLTAMAQKVEADRQTKAQVRQVGDQVGNALLVGGALVALAALLDWLISNGRR